VSKKTSNTNQLNTFARYSGIGIQIGVTIYLGKMLGNWLDEKYNNQDELYTKVVTLVAVFLAMYSVIKQVTRMSSDDNKND
jgi:membrane protein DedA with SNARE-associated domain